LAFPQKTTSWQTWLHWVGTLEISSFDSGYFLEFSHLPKTAITVASSGVLIVAFFETLVWFFLSIFFFVFVLFCLVLSCSSPAKAAAISSQSMASPP